MQATNKVIEMFGSERSDLKLGRSFYKNKEGAFHTIRYDFKPASIDHSKAASLEVKDGNEVNISFPNDESKGAPSSTNFKGPLKPCQKDCVLIYDHRSGEVTLERLTSSINVKIQRLEGRSKAKPPPAAAKPSNIKPNTSQLKMKTGKKTKQSTKPKSEPSKVEREPVREPSPPPPSPPLSQRPPTPDAVTCTLSDESSPEPAPVTHRLSQDSSDEERDEDEEEEEEAEVQQHQQHHQQHQQQQQQQQQQPQQPEESDAASSSSDEDDSSSNNSSSEEEEEEQEEEEEEEEVPQVPVSKQKRQRIESPPSSPPPPQTKARRGSAQILNQLQHDLSLSSSESEDSD